MYGVANMIHGFMEQADFVFQERSLERLTIQNVLKVNQKSDLTIPVRPPQGIG